MKVQSRDMEEQIDMLSLSDQYGQRYIFDLSKAEFIDNGWEITNFGELCVARALRAMRLSWNTIKTQHRLRYRTEHQERRRWRSIDFALPSVKVAIEADGYHHKTDAGRAKDHIRDEELRSLGWLTVRVDIDVLINIDDIVEHLTGDTIRGYEFRHRTHKLITDAWKDYDVQAMPVVCEDD